MAINVEQWARNQTLAAPQKPVLMQLAYHARKDGARAFPGIDLLAFEAGYGRTAVKGALKVLESIGLIEAVSHRRGGHGRATEWRCCIENGVKTTGRQTTSRYRQQQVGRQPVGIGNNRSPDETTGRQTTNNRSPDDTYRSPGDPQQSVTVSELSNNREPAESQIENKSNNQPDKPQNPKAGSYGNHDPGHSADPQPPHVSTPEASAGPEGGAVQVFNPLTPDDDFEDWKAQRAAARAAGKKPPPILDEKAPTRDYGGSGLLGIGETLAPLLPANPSSNGGPPTPATTAAPGNNPVDGEERRERSRIALLKAMEQEKASAAREAQLDADQEEVSG